MKKATAVFFLCFVLVLGCAAGLALPVYQSREEVEVTSTSLAGDPAEAAGLTANQGLLYQNRLVWDLTVPVDRPQETETQFTYYARTSDLPQAPLLYWGVDLWGPSGEGADFSADVPQQAHTLEEIVAWGLISPHFAPIYADVISRAPHGTTYTETVDLDNYLDACPLGLALDLPLNINAAPGNDPKYSDLQAAFMDFFTLPIQEGDHWTVTVQLQEDGSVQAFNSEGLWGYDPLEERNAVGETTCYFSFSLPQTGAAPDFSQVPGGFGVYAIDYPQGDLDLDSLRNFYPLDPETCVLSLTLTEEEDELFLVTWRDGVYVCTVLDPVTAAVRQEFPIVSGPPAGPDRDWDVLDFSRQGDALLFSGLDAFHLYERAEDGYVPVMTVQPLDFMEPYDPVWAWNGEKLAVGVFGAGGPNCEDLGFRLAVYERDGTLVYHGSYRNSLSDIDDLPGTEYEVDDLGYPKLIGYLSSNRLTLTWN